MQSVAPVTTLAITIPGTPQPKQRARRDVRGKWYTPDETIAWAKHAKSCASVAIMRAGWKRPLVGGVDVRAIAVAHDHRPRDLDNTAGKALCDALNGVVWYDDRQVHRSDHVRAVDAAAPGLYVEVSALEAWDDPTASETPKGPDKRMVLCGWSRSPERRVWLNMVARCTFPHHEAWDNYGGRGIRVADEWLGDAGWWRFLLHIGGRPAEGYDLDRIDNNGHYEPGNVRWTTRKVNNRNRRTNVMVGDVTQAEAADSAGISRALLAYRIRAGWTIEEAMQPAGAGRSKSAASRKARAKRVEAYGESLTIAEWAAKTGLKSNTIHKRLSLGATPEQALKGWTP